MLSDLADLIEEGHLDQRASVRSKTSANLAGRRRSSQLGRDDLSTGSEAPTNRRSVVRQAPEPAGRKALRNIRKASRSYEHVAASSRGAIHVGKASHRRDIVSDPPFIIAFVLPFLSTTCVVGRHRPRGAVGPPAR